MKTVIFSKTLLPVYQTARRNSPEERHRDIDRPWNLIFRDTFNPFLRLQRKGSESRIYNKLGRDGLARLAIDSTVSVQGLAADYCEQSFKRSD
jgi:hypothetical protein